METAAAGLDLLVRKHLTIDKEVGAASPLFGMEIKTEEANSFVQSHSRRGLHRLLREGSTEIEGVDLKPLVDLLGPESPTGDELFEMLQQRLSGDLYGSSDQERQAELLALLAMLDGLVEGPAPPLHLNADDVDLVTERGRVADAVSGQITQWLADAEPNSFRSVWPTAPSIYVEHCEPIIEQATDSEWILGSGVRDSLEPAIDPEWLPELGVEDPPNDRKWLKSMQETEQLDVRSSQYGTSLIILLLDETLILGLDRYSTNAETDVVLRTRDPAMRDWGAAVIDVYRVESERI